MKKLGIAAAVAALLIGGAIAAPASADTTLTFEGQPNTIYNAPITRSGFELGNLAGDEQHFHEIDSTQFGLASNGTGVLLVDRDSSIFLQASDLSDFTLTNFDIAAAFSNSPGLTFVVTGFLNGLQTSTVAGSLGQFATFSGAALGTVDYVLFDGFGDGGGFELDNIVLNGDGSGVVPEPATWAMMLMGFAGMGAMLRSRRRAALAA